MAKKPLDPANLSLADLKAAGYNPRAISSSRLKQLETSIQTFGDLSGLVLNKRTGLLVSGHQRTKIFNQPGVKTKIVTEAVTDSFGTVATGYVLVIKDGRKLRVPLRIVDWSDKKTEMAANIAANAHGGEFDKEKLRKVLAQLEDTTFAIETVGLDPLTIKSLKTAGPQPDAGEGDVASGGAFPEYSPEGLVFEHQCPKCHFRWGGKGKARKD